MSEQPDLGPTTDGLSDEERRAQANSEWRREFFGTQRRRGNAFRDSMYLALEDRGLTGQKEWQTEKKSPIENDLPDRFLDLYRKRNQAGVEMKVGGGDHQHLMTQIANDLSAVQAGDDRIWLHRDLSRLKDRQALEALHGMQRKYPDRFALVDASDPKSVESFRERFPQYKGVADSIPEAKQVFDHYDSQYEQRTANGQEYTISDARQEWLSAKQVQQLATTGMRPANQIRRPSPGHDHNADGVRTTPATEVARRVARTQGAPLREVQSPSPGRAGGAPARQR